MRCRRHYWSCPISVVRSANALTVGPGRVAVGVLGRPDRDLADLKLAHPASLSSILSAVQVATD
jgi:hypothetical protein